MKDDERRVWDETWNRLSDDSEGVKVTVLDEFDPSIGRPSNGDKVRPADLVGAPLLVKVNAVNEGVNTSYGPKDAVDVDVVGISTGNVARDLRWFNPAIVDPLKPYVGKTVPLKLTWQTGNSGRAYLAAESLSEIEVQAAKTLVAKGDPFALEEPSPAVKSDAPVDEGPLW